MTMANRVRMPRPERTGPIRGGTLGIFGSPEPAPPAGEDDEGAPTPGDAIMRTVEHAYRVIDDHVKQGESAARRVARREYGPGAFAHDVQDAAARSAQFLAEIFEVWLQAGSAFATPPPSGAVAPIGVSTSNGSVQPVGSTARDTVVAGTGETPLTGPAQARIVVSVDSTGPASVTVDLQATARPLSVQPLLGPGDPITSVSLLPTQPPHLHVRVPPQQTPGVYSGLVVDQASNRPLGSVVVEVAKAGTDRSQSA